LWKITGVGKKGEVELEIITALDIRNVRVGYGNHVVVAGIPNGHAVDPLPFFILVGSAAILDQPRGWRSERIGNDF